MPSSASVSLRSDPHGCRLGTLTLQLSGHTHEPERVVLLHALEERCYTGDPWVVFHLHLHGCFVLLGGCFTWGCVIGVSLGSPQAGLTCGGLAGGCFTWHCGRCLTCFDDRQLFGEALVRCSGGLVFHVVSWSHGPHVSKGGTSKPDVAKASSVWGNAAGDYILATYR